MEAIPRLPMLSFDLKRTPEYVEFGPVLKQYIKTHYGEDPALYNKPCSDLEQLRQEATQVVCDYLGCTILKKYYAQLQFLQGRFPMKEGEEAAIPFTWEDIQTGRDHVGDIKFEQASILYNIGSLHSLLGVLDTRQNAEGMKVSCTHFQCAAWAFEYLRDNFGSSSMSTDMSFELLSFQILLMLAQAQECILEKSMLDGRKNNITAKVAVQVVDFYRQAINAIDNCDSKHQINSRMHKEWRKRMTVKQALYLCITYYYQGRQSEEAEKHGECLAFFTGAKDKLAEASKLAKNEVAEITECLKYCQDVVLGKYESAKKDNDFVYHDKVPALDTLPEVKGASLVKGIPFNPNDKEISGPDIFQKLVPIEAHEASSVYSEEKAKLIRTVKGSIEQKNMDLEQFMSSLQLDMESLIPKPDTMPEHLMEKCAAMSVRTNAIQELTDSMAEVSGLATEVELGINEIQELIDVDTTRTEQFEEQYGRKKPSQVLQGLLSELTVYRERHEKGSQLNNTLHKAMNKHTNNLKMLTLPPSDILTRLPSSQPNLNPEEEAIVSEVRRLLQKVNEMRDQRKDFLDKLIEQLHNDDITNALVTHQDMTDKDQLYADQLKKHDPLVQHINMNLSAQEKILRSLTDANAKFALIRQNFTKAATEREKTVEELIMSYEKYEELLTKCAKGSDYNKKLLGNVNKTLNRCRSECKVRQEERDMLISQFAPKVSAPSRPSAPKPGAGAVTPGMNVQDPSSRMPVDVTDPSGVQTIGPDVLSTFPTHLPPDFEGPKLKDYLPFMKPQSFGPKPQSPQPPAPGDPSHHPLLPSVPPESPQALDPRRGDWDPNLAHILPASIAQYIAATVTPAMAGPKHNNQQTIHNQPDARDPRHSNTASPQPPHSSPLRQQQLPPSHPPSTSQYPTIVSTQSPYYNAAIPPHQAPNQYPQIPNSTSAITPSGQGNYLRMPQTSNPRMPHPGGPVVASGQPAPPSQAPRPVDPNTMPVSGYYQSNRAAGYPSGNYYPQQLPPPQQQQQYPQGIQSTKPDITNTVSSSDRPLLSSGKDLIPNTTPMPQQQQQPFGTYQQQYLPHQQQNQQPQFQQPPYNPKSQTPMPPSSTQHQPPQQPNPQQAYHAPYQVPASAGAVPTSMHQYTPANQSSNLGYHQNYPPSQHGQRMMNPSQVQGVTNPPGHQNVPSSATHSQPPFPQAPPQGNSQNQPIIPAYQQPQQQQQQERTASSHQPPPAVPHQHNQGQFQHSFQPGQQPTNTNPPMSGYGVSVQNQTGNQTQYHNTQMAHQTPTPQSAQAQLPGHNVPTSQQYPTQIMPGQQYGAQTVPSTGQQYGAQTVPTTGQQYGAPTVPTTGQQYGTQTVPVSQHYPNQTPVSQPYRGPVPPNQTLPSSQQQYYNSPHGSPIKGNQNTSNTTVLPNTTALSQQQQQQQLPQQGMYNQQFQPHQNLQQQVPQSQHHPYLQQQQQHQIPNQHQVGLNQPKPSMMTMTPGDQGRGQNPPAAMSQVPAGSIPNNLVQPGGVHSNISTQTAPGHPPPTNTNPLASNKQQMVPQQGTAQASGYQGYHNQQQLPKQHPQHPQQPTMHPAVQGGYQPVAQQRPQPFPTQHQQIPPQQQHQYPPYQSTQQQGFYPQPPSHQQIQPPAAAAVVGNIQPGMYTAGPMPQPLQPKQLSKSHPPAAGLQPQQHQPLPPPQQQQQPGLAHTMVGPTQASPASQAPLPQVAVVSDPATTASATTIAPATSSTPPMSIGRQNSSLDDILSSSPNGAGDSLPITPQVLTDQERQLQKEQAKKNLSQPAFTSEPYGCQGALHKLLSDVEAFGQLVDNLSLSILGVSRLDSIWKSLVDSQDSNSKRQSIAIARCYPMKNRDPDIMPYDETRVVLSSTKDDYINASWLNDLAPSCPKFITTQSPLPHTLVDFWTMVYEQGTEVLVQITSEYETGKMFPVYYPTERDKPVEQGPLIISLQSVKFRQNWVERIVYLKNNVTKQGRTVVHLQFKSWPVSGFPDDVTTIVHFISEVHNFYKQQRTLTKPIIVHCGVGVGRSGVLVAVYASIQELLHGNGLLDIPGLSKRLLHKQKGILLKKEQLYCVYQCLLCFAEDFLNKRGVLVKAPHFASSSSSSSSSASMSKDANASSSREGSNPPPTHAVDDIVFGQVDIETIRANVGLLHVTADKDKKPAANTMSTESLATSSKNDMASLPDVVQQHNGQSLKGDQEMVGGHVRQGSNTGLAGGGGSGGSDKGDKMIVADLSGHQDGENNDHTPSATAAAGDEGKKKAEIKSSLAQLQDPTTFTLGSPEKHQARITKTNFSHEEGRLTGQKVDPSVSDDPLASLDPLWSLGK